MLDRRSDQMDGNTMVVALLSAWSGDGAHVVLSVEEERRKRVLHHAVERKSVARSTDGESRD
jgi:anti-sigma factor RsiW